MSNICVNTKLNKDVYSTEEVKTNKVWIDGKPIYRKVTTFTALSDFNTNISNLNVVVDAKIIIKGSGTEWRNLPWLYAGSTYGDASWAGGFYITRAGRVIIQAGSSISNITYGHIVILYTKTTD